MTYNSVLLLICFIYAHSVSAATRTAVASANWATNSTWDCNCAPLSTDNMIIPSGFNVTISFPGATFNNATIITITISGTLTLASSSLTVDSPDVIVINSGGQIVSTGVGSAVFSGVVPFTTFPINGPATITGGVLPIKLLYFRASPSDGKVLLEWASEIEENFDCYYIERSFDGILFEQISKITSSGNKHGPNKYSLYDFSPISGTSYYRLKAKDLDGTVETFKIISICSDVVDDLSIFPNPLIGLVLFMSVNFKLEKSDHFAIYNGLGNTVHQQLIDPNKSEIELPFLQPGVYFIELVTNRKIFRKIIIKR